MRLWLKQCVAVLALYAVALHLALFAFLPAGTGATLDPFSVICHAGTAATDDGRAADPTLLPGHACDHCNLCSAATAPAPGVVFIGHVAPADLLQIFRPLSARPTVGIAFRPNLARGPPSFV